MTSKSNDPELLYFGYGSNLDAVDWAEFCRRERTAPDCLEPLGPAALPDFELAFNYRSVSRGGGALNLKRRFGQVVDGYLFRITEGGWRLLDRKEGAPSYYEHLDTVALQRDGIEVRVRTYRVCAQREQGFVAPSAEYLEIARRGRQRFGLSEAMLRAAAVGGEPAVEVAGLFAYGTLMKGEPRFPFVGEAGLARVQPATARGTLYSLGDWPALAVGLGESVSGELLVVNDLTARLEQLDRIEGFFGFGSPRNLFRRTLLSIDVEREGPRRAWAYVMDRLPNQAARIPGGDWRAYRRAGSQVSAPEGWHAASAVACEGEAR